MEKGPKFQSQIAKKTFLLNIFALTIQIMLTQVIEITVTQGKLSD